MEMVWGETPCDLTKPRIAPNKKYLETSVYGCNLKLAQQRGLQFYQTRSQNTLPAVCIEKAVCMKTKEELCHKICLTPRLPRVVLKAKSRSGQQDQREQDARTSWEPSSDSKSSRETWNRSVDYRILGIPCSTVEQQDTIRKDKGQEVDWAVREPPVQGTFPSGLGPDAEDQ